MVDENHETRDQKKQDAFTPEGEAVGYISLEQATVVAMRTARSEPGNYGKRFAGVAMVFKVVEQQKGEDYYAVTLAFRPEGDFKGTEGHEQFFIEKEGAVAHRQVFDLPRRRRSRAAPIAVGLVALAIVAAGGAVFAVAARGGDGGTPAAATPRTPTPEPRATATATVTPTPVPVVVPSPTPTPMGVVSPQRAQAPSATLSPTPTGRLTVTNLNDSGPGSLRQAITDAPAGSAIDFSVAATITLTSGELVIDKDLIINGPGAAIRSRL